jgi:AcrR family transcriptional regulator
MPRTSPTRQRILELAISAIDEGGEVAVRVNDLAGAAGVTIPTLYRYFGSRDNLVAMAQAHRFLQTQIADAVVAAALARCKNREELWKVLRKELLTHFEADRWELRQTRVNALGSGYARPELTASLALVQKQVAMAVAEMLLPFQKKGWIRKDIDLLAAVYWYQGLVLGRALIEMGDNPVPAKNWNEVALDGIRAVLFGDTIKK